MAMASSTERNEAHWTKLGGTPLVGLLLTLVGCSGIGSTTDENANDAGVDGGDELVVEELHPNAPPLDGETECKVVITKGIPQQKTYHEDLCVPVTYETNPPSSGPHWGVWASYKIHETPIPREVYVHDMEHGAVVLSYACDDCDDVVAALTDAFNSVPADPLCVMHSTIARVLMTKDPELSTPIAASAWRATYTATCIDPPSLSQFIQDAYGRGTEATCSPGKDPSDGSFACGGGGGGGGGGGSSGSGAGGHR